MTLLPSSTVLGSFAVFHICLFIYTEISHENPAGIPLAYTRRTSTTSTQQHTRSWRDKHLMRNPSGMNRNTCVPRSRRNDFTQNGTLYKAYPCTLKALLSTFLTFSLPYELVTHKMHSQLTKLRYINGRTYVTP